MLIQNFDNISQICYIAHIHDSLNFDIDLQFNINNKSLTPTNYSFKKIENNNILPSIFHSRTYRCRLQGIKLKDNRNIKQNKLFNTQRILSNIDVNNLINFQDGWILLNTHYIDKYNRILVSIFLFDSITGKKKNLVDYLIEKYPKIYQTYY